MSESYPPWLKKRVPRVGVLGEMKRLFDGLALHTVCQSALCPNQGECFSERTATFLILGDVCTRGCRFCAVAKGQPKALDPAEPDRVAQAVAALDLKHVVITSVTRDDLDDGGARHFAAVVSSVRGASPRTTVELLIPDFRGSRHALETIVGACPEVVGHNAETVPRLYSAVRAQADYPRSVDLLHAVKSLDNGIVIKSGLMLGLGESHEEVKSVMADLRNAGCDILTLGQYLAPSKEHVPVFRYVRPDEFAGYRRLAAMMGFRAAAAGPFVRSSFKARELYGLGCWR